MHIQVDSTPSRPFTEKDITMMDGAKYSTQLYIHAPEKDSKPKSDDVKEANNSKSQSTLEMIQAFYGPPTPNFGHTEETEYFKIDIPLQTVAPGIYQYFVGKNFKNDSRSIDTIEVQLKALGDFKKEGFSAETTQIVTATYRSMSDFSGPLTLIDLKTKFVTIKILYKGLSALIASEGSEMIFKGQLPLIDPKTLGMVISCKTDEKVVLYPGRLGLHSIGKIVQCYDDARRQVGSSLKKVF